MYKGMGGAWKPDEYDTLIDQFPEGQICIEDKGRVVAAALTILVNAEEFESRRHTYEDIVNGGQMSGHDPDGNALYDVDIFVDPDSTGDSGWADAFTTPARNSAKPFWCYFQNFSMPPC